MRALRLGALFVVVFASVIAYSWTTRTRGITQTEPVSVAPVSAEAEPAKSPAVPEPAPTFAAVPVTEPTPSERVAKWVADASSDDPDSRAAAIESLASAPKAQAVPVLKNVLDSGHTTGDRKLALQSLRRLAMDQGDADGAIKNIVRRFAYHDSDEDLVRYAQEVLNELEL